MSQRFTDSSGSRSPLTELAQEDAQRITPAFSPILHARIVQSVESPPVLRIVPSHTPMRLTWVTPVALAAAIALVVAPVWIWRNWSGGIVHTPSVAFQPTHVVRAVDHERSV